MEAAWSRTRLSSRVEDEDLQHDLADEKCVQAARFGLAADWHAQGVSSYPRGHHTFASRTAFGRTYSMARTPHQLSSILLAFICWTESESKRSTGTPDTTAQVYGHEGEQPFCPPRRTSHVLHGDQYGISHHCNLSCEAARDRMLAQLVSDAQSATAVSHVASGQTVGHKRREAADGEIVAGRKGHINGV